ncbi:MAG: hypothetical protein K0B11_22630, partial [Mariniphaga sp.]|nr:hypothetical protein [Mariniphaga sp.]
NSTRASGENHTWFWLESHVVLIETTLGFGSSHTWFEVKPCVVFYFKQNQPVNFRNRHLSAPVKSRRAGPLVHAYLPDGVER